MAHVDPAKRRRIMQRSMKLGHCVCDPRRPCPCDVYTQQGICPCAGERPAPADLSQVRLTELVHSAGCASKIAAADLEHLLSRLPPVSDPAIISGLPAGDDAGVYRIAEGLTLVQTVDVFTPCVDEPHLFGRICAANCLSDIYAMGGRPRTALSILAFPSERLDGRIMHLMLKGAMETLAEAECSLIGGHSIKDDEIKLGFAITGTIDPQSVVAMGAARRGDLLVLTKPLGVGVLSFARQVGRQTSPAGWAAAEAAMAALNKPAAEAMLEVGVSACTDITGFGLFGHLIRMARQSGLTARVQADKLPAFEGVMEALREGVVPGAVERNREFVGDDLIVGQGVDESFVNLGLDAQTSGGLLISVPPGKHPRLLSLLAERGQAATTIGEFTGGPEGRIELVTSGDQAAAGPVGRARAIGGDEAAGPQPGLMHSQPCCADAPGTPPDGGAGSAAESLRAFGSLVRSAGAAGALDEKTKELITFALVLLARCRPCLTAHLKKARDMGISQAELDEAAWCAVAMGGAPVRMFHQEVLDVSAGSKGACC